MRPALIIERRGTRWYACWGMAGGYGDTPEEACAELERRLAWGERIFTARLP